MNERIKELAEQALLKDYSNVKDNGTYALFAEELERFAELVRQDEREACAKLCESLVTYWGQDTFAAAIRGRTE
jgi:hypothetical protein